MTGGRDAPGLDAVPGARSLRLPPIERTAGGIAPVHPGQSLEQVLAERRRLLIDAVETIRPDVVITEHFPFSKWALEPEIVPVLERTRAVNPAVRIVCSLRDIARRSRFDGGQREYADEVLPTLNPWYDALLVHGDPSLTRLDDQLDWVDEIELPILYTGYVVQPLGDRPAPPPAEEGFVLLSAGGGREAHDLICPVLDAWPAARSQAVVDDRRLVVFTGPYVDAAEYQDLARRCRDVGAELRRFAPDFQSWMGAADLSVSRAGYNTCANVLVTGTRAVLVPSPRMSDQEWRAHRLAQRGWVDVIDPDDLHPDRVLEVIRNGLDRPRPEPDLALDGAARTAEIVDELVANRPPIGI